MFAAGQDPNGHTRAFLALAYHESGRNEEALAECQAALGSTTLREDAFAMGFVGFTCGRLGHRREALDLADELEARGVRVPVRLLAASPFVLRFPHTYLNAVDPGRMLYGITFPAETPPLPLRPVLRALATRVIAVKELAPRERFAEQAPFPVTGPMRLGVVPMGSADGLSWLHAGRVLVRGRAAPVIGSPSLEHTRIDLTAIPEATVGDEAIIIGRQGDLEITPAEVAARHGLGPHHVATTVGPRVPRVYRGQVLHCDISSKTDP